MIKHSPNPPPSYDASLLRDAADRAINHYLHPEPPTPTAQPSDPASAALFTVRTDLDAETLLIMTQQHNMKEENILYPMCDQHLADVSEALIGRLQEGIGA